MSRKIDTVLRDRQGNYMLPFFWQHGEDEATLRDYMRAIYDSNIRAVCVESRPHPDFAGPTWWRDMDIILDEAAKREMKVWILDDSHFPTGFANGAMKTAPRALKHQYMVSRTLEMAGPVYGAEFDLKTYMQPEPLPPWLPQPPKDPSDDFFDDQLVRILACPILPGEVLGQPLDLTDQIQDGIVRFDLPASPQFGVFPKDHRSGSRRVETLAGVGHRYGKERGRLGDDLSRDAVALVSDDYAIVGEDRVDAQGAGSVAEGRADEPSALFPDQSAEFRAVRDLGDTDPEDRSHGRPERPGTQRVGAGEKNGVLDAERGGGTEDSPHVPRVADRIEEQSPLSRRAGGRPFG